MEFNAYENNAKATALYPKKAGVLYTSLGLANESGEVLGKIKKIIRDFDGSFKDGIKEKKSDLEDELGDVLWYVTMLAVEIGSSLEQVAQRNNSKLLDRMERGKIKGSGDKR